MTPQEHAKIWREAARVVAAMDGRQQLLAQVAAQQQQGQYQNLQSRSQGAEEVAMWSAYAGAASVLYKIASEYERAVTSSG